MPRHRTAAQFARHRDMTERSITQWALINALAFAERAGIVICAFLFFFNESRDFWSFWGLGFVVAYVLFLAPVFGIFIFFTERLAYRARRGRGQPVLDQKSLKNLGRAVHVLWFPLMALSSWVMFDLYDRFMPPGGPVDFWRALFT